VYIQDASGVTFVIGGEASGVDGTAEGNTGNANATQETTPETDLTFPVIP